jgi:oxygen-dependent protoporphyrinogen oxidase
VRNSHKVVVIGAGISGLACAYRLKQLGVRPLVLEASERAGGAIRTVRRDGYTFEMGPQAPRFSAPVWQIVRELGLEREFVAGDPKAARYIARNGKLERAPFSPGAMLATGLVGSRSKLRVLAEPFGFSRPPTDEESVAAFMRRKFGDEILDYLVDPIVSTVFLGDAEKMGMASAFPALVEWERTSGSLARGALRARSKRRRSGGDASSGARRNGSGEKLKVTDALPSLGSFRDGMATLTDAMARALADELRLGASVASVARLDRGGWEISTHDGERVGCDAVVSATPAFATSAALGTAMPAVAQELSSIEYAPMTVAALAYDRAQVANSLDGFGLMVPSKEKLRTIATFWNSSLFPMRAPAGKVVITSFARGAESDVSSVVSENARLLGISGEPVACESWRSEHAMPQYNVGHAARVARIRTALESTPGLHLAGNYLSGRSIGECVDSAFREADSIVARVAADAAVSARAQERLS